MNQMLEKIILIILVFLGFYSSFYFGYILTGEHHVGALFGIPFALILAVFSALTIFTKNKLKKAFRILTLGYIVTMLAYVSNNNDN